MNLRPQSHCTTPKDHSAAGMVVNFSCGKRRDRPSSHNVHSSPFNSGDEATVLNIRHAIGDLDRGTGRPDGHPE